MQKIRIFISVLLAAVCTVAAVLFASSSFSYPLPHTRIAASDRYALFDAGAIATGFRRLGADIAWVQLLQYYGSPEKPLDRDTEFQLSWDMTKYLFGRGVEKEVCNKEGCHDRHHYHPQIEGGVYPGFLERCYRVVNLDPFFNYAYLYGAGALAWNLNRPEEALELLQRGITAMEKYRPDITRDIHQPYWQLNLYVSAILYRQSGQDQKMVALLETAVRQPGAPNMVKSVLANIYQKDGRLMSALKLWVDIYDSKDPSYRARAAGKIEELGRLLRI